MADSTASRRARRRAGLRSRVGATREGGASRAAGGEREEHSTASRRARRRLGKPGKLADPPFAAAGVLLLAALVFAAWSGWSWFSAPRTSNYAQARDEALQGGEQAVLNFNTLDYRRVGQGLNLWEQSSTGALHHEIVASLPTFEQQIRQAETITTAKILDAALTALNLRAGTASIMVALQVTVTPAHGAATVKYSRLAGGLTRTPHGWKLSALGQVPVQAAAAGRAPSG